MIETIIMCTIWFFVGYSVKAYRDLKLSNVFTLRAKQRHKDEDEYERKLEKLDRFAAYVAASKKAMWN